MSSEPERPSIMIAGESSADDAANAQAWQHHYSKASVVASYRGDDHLQPPEATIFARLAPELAQARTLDVGVGGGRTSIYLAPRCRTYTAVDFAVKMVAACRERFSREAWFGSATFIQADARELPFDDDAFDLVVFSFNGIDYVPPADRMRALAQCRRVLRRGGCFVYSSHNLNWVAGQGMLPRRGSWRGWLDDHAFRRRMLRLNARHGPFSSTEGLDLREPPDGLRVYYGRPAEHLRQAQAAGFSQLQVFDSNGRELEDRAALGAARDPWLYFMGRAADATTPGADAVGAAGQAPGR